MAVSHAEMNLSNFDSDDDLPLADLRDRHGSGEGRDLDPEDFGSDAASESEDLTHAEDHGPEDSDQGSDVDFDSDDDSDSEGQTGVLIGVLVLLIRPFGPRI